MIPWFRTLCGTLLVLQVSTGCGAALQEEVEGDGRAPSEALLTTPGFKGEYFVGSNLEKLTLTRTDAAANFDWQSGSPNSALPSDGFSVRWTGFVVPKASESYTFYLWSDDGVRLWVNGIQVINDWNVHSASERKASVSLEAGKAYAVRLEYFERTGKAVVKMSWSSKSVAKQVIQGVQITADATSSTGTPCPTSRDPGTWPFSPTSPWNRPMGSGALFASPASPAFSSSGGGNVNVTSWSHPVTFASPSDPIRTVYRNGVVCTRTQIPQAAAPDAQADGHMHVIDVSHNFVVEMFGAARRADGDIDARACVVNSLADEGVYPTWHGVRAYGGSALGGLIRKGELTHGIPHALAAAVRAEALNKYGPEGKPYIWPASSADSFWNTGYGSSGNLFMGTLLAIPPSVDINTLGLSGPALNMARAAQDYGVYIVDVASTNMVFSVEPAAAAEVPSTLNTDVDKVVAALRIVPNQGPGPVTGGGTARTCRAPSLEP